MRVRALTLTATIATMVAVPALRASAQDVKPDWREVNAYGHKPANSVALHTL